MCARMNAPNLYIICFFACVLPRACSVSVNLETRMFESFDV